MKNLFYILIILFFCHSTLGAEKTIKLASGVIFHIEVDSIKKSELQNIGTLFIDNILFIANKPVFGTCCGEIPNEKVKSAYISINNKVINLDVSYMYDPNLFTLDERSFKVVTKKNLFVINAKFSDGAGTYVVQWVISDNNSTRTVISGDEDILIALMFKDEGYR
jgi:hypothetical protein